MEKLLVIRNDIAQMPRLADFTEEIARELFLSSELASELKLVLEEAVANVINYAYPTGVSEEISLKASLEGSRLMFTLTDSGVEFDPTKFPEADVTLPAIDRKIGGLGIFLIRKIMDDMEYQRVGGRNILTLVKEI